jgi:hypothetical protein
LKRLASESRGTGGFFDVLKLLRALRPDFQLLNYPDIEVDWSQLDALARKNINDIRAVIGADARIARNDVTGELLKATRTATVVVVVGESGSGATRWVDGRSATLRHL